MAIDFLIRFANDGYALDHLRIESHWAELIMRYEKNTYDFFYQLVNRLWDLGSWVLGHS